ncbi:MAG: class II aldolase/adducin family protein [Syntrophales bacterium]|nr:class II aldolase/adducin family protein [Syntrophales bacterium]
MMNSYSRDKITEIIRLCAERLFRGGLTEENAPLIALSADSGIVLDGEGAGKTILEDVMRELQLRSIILSQPAEPYRSIIDFLSAEAGAQGAIWGDRRGVLFRSLPVIEKTAEAALSVLRRRRGAVVSGLGIMAAGRSGSEEAFDVYYSICFGCFVRFFSECLRLGRNGSLGRERMTAFSRAVSFLDPQHMRFPDLARGPFQTEEEAKIAIEEAGRNTVRYRLVDSSYGNISYRLGGKLLISRTGIPLDELRGAIETCPLGEETCLTPASRELPAHRRIVLETENRAVLHGHPKFSVVLSLDHDSVLAGKGGVAARIDDVPVVAGKPGEGPDGLHLTVPPALNENRGVIVYGHGVFTAGREDFNEAFRNMLEIERMCRDKYFHEIH